MAADFPNVLQGHYGLRLQTKLPPMDALRGGGSVFITSNGAEGLPEGGSLLPLTSSQATSFGKAGDELFVGSAMSYDDVFGGPPRYVTALLASQAGPPPALDAGTFKTCARVPSFRGLSLPVFELPVFGDDAFGDVDYFPRPTAMPYEDVFNERPSAVNLSGHSRSKPSSCSSSRCHSPVHPAASVAACLPVLEDPSNSISSASFLTGRSAGGKSKRSTSFSFLDETKGKPANSSYVDLIIDPAASNWPSSPPQVNRWDHMQKSLLSNCGKGASSLGNGLDANLDDVFHGSFKRVPLMLFQSFPYVQEAVGLDTKPSRTHGVATAENPLMKSSTQGSRSQGVSSIIDTHDISSSPLSHDDEQDLRDNCVELRMKRQADSHFSEKCGGAARIMVGAARESIRSLSKVPPPHLSPASATIPLQCRSWKDWAVEFSANHPANSPHHSSLSHGRNERAESIEGEESGDEDTLSGFIDEWVKTVAVLSPEQQSNWNSADISAAGNKMATSSAKDINAEHEETALKINAKEVKEKVAVPLQEKSEGAEEDLIGLQWKDLRKKASRQVKASQSKEMEAAPSDRDMDMHREKRRIHSTEERNEDLIKEMTFTQKIACQVPKIADPVFTGIENTVYREKVLRVAASETAGMEPPSIESHIPDLRARHSKDSAKAENRKGSTAQEKMASSSKRISCELAPSNGGSTPAGQAWAAEASNNQIKCWATGKERNLRALLSNLQHVLWPDSGWQPVPLTDLIEGAAVKKAYRKATLFLHPDKMQQKGATTEQKYVAARVFDILQEAWKTFSNLDLF